MRRIIVHLGSKYEVLLSSTRPSRSSGEATKRDRVGIELVIGQKHGGVSLRWWPMTGLKVHIEVMISDKGLVALRAGNLALCLVSSPREFIDEVDLLVGRSRLRKLGSFQAEMLVADVILKADLGAELVAAALIIRPALKSCAAEIHLAADKAEALVCGAYMGVEVGFLGELLFALGVGACDSLSVLDSLSRVVHFHMLLQLPTSTGFEVAEQTVLVLLADMGLE